MAKYFNSIDHGILLSQIRRRIKDKSVYLLVEKIIRNSDQCRDLSTGQGLPIGNLTSQFLANLYLDPLYHFLKEEIGFTAYPFLVSGFFQLL